MADRIEEMLRATAVRRPDAVALVKGERSLTYRELFELVDEAAARIAVANEGTAPVAIHAVKTIETVVCMMGCLVAGIPYVPVDASMPAARRAAVLERAGSTLFLYDENEPRQAPGTGESGARVRTISSLADEDGRAVPEAEPSEVAYILFTSGSTGTPKGVVTLHTNLLSCLDWLTPLMGWEQEDRVLCYAPLHFDMYPLDVYGSLGTGATAVLTDDRSVLFPQAMADLVREQRITVFMAVPSAWIGLLRLEHGDQPDPLSSLRRVIYSAEEFPAVWLRKLVERLPGRPVVNIYGLVETNAVIGYELRPEHIAQDRVPLGYPLGPNRVILLGDDGVPLTGPGAQGEIVVDGPSLSPRYLADPATTDAAWLEVVDLDGTKLTCFRTGDYGEYDAGDGIIHFRGRRDHRIKTRGHRVELGDVESALSAHPGVLRAVAVPRPHAEVTNELVAFAESRDASLDERELISWMRGLLPAYMVPRQIFVTEALPRTATGKADRQTLLRRVLD
jgi:amino acid adenylation domain-containing protein